jgi:hypothetical protein
MMRTLAGDNTMIAFEGQVAHTELAKITGVSLSETEILRRNTTSPRMDFVVLPLTRTTVAGIERAVVSKIAFKGSSGIIHVQIEREGHLAFAAYDQFHEDCVWVSSDISESFLADLVERRILYSYKPA